MMLEYKGYIARVELEDEGDFHGRVLNTRDVISFQGRTARELRRELAKSIETYLAFCAERGEAPEKPYSGKLLLRVQPELHQAIALEAAKAEVSINTWVNETLRQRVRRTGTRY